MKKMVTILLVMAMVMVSANLATAGVFKKGDKAEEVQTEEKTIIDYMTPMNVLVAEYYKMVAQKKQKEIEAEVIQKDLDRLDAVIRYQQGIEQKIKQDQTEEK